MLPVARDEILSSRRVGFGMAGEGAGALVGVKSGQTVISIIDMCGPQGVGESSVELHLL